MIHREGVTAETFAELIRELGPIAKSEAMQACGNQPGKIWIALQRCPELSAFRLDGKLLCVVGYHVDSLLSAEALVWVIATEEMTHHAFLFIRHARIYLQHLAQRFDSIKCLIYGSQPKQHHWTRLLGFHLVRSRTDDGRKINEYKFGEP